MREVTLPPFAPAMLESMRAIGYSFEAALADIIDNSIAAGAAHVEVSFRSAPKPYVAVVDDGEGMTADGLLEAMRHGGLGPSRPRSERDLGRFGLGLKTASLSQCRRLTVISRRQGVTVGASWDVDVIDERQDWVVQMLDSQDIRPLPHIGELEANESGTIVLWQNLDRALAGEADPGHALGRLVDNARDHLALAFHRFLGPASGEQGLSISINRQVLPVVDPFLASRPSTKVLPIEELWIEGAKVSFKPFILPHITKMNRDDLVLAGGEEGLRRYQGFYVYRGRRLITHGTWFRLLRQGELTKLARVQVDIPNSLDHLWALDVKKSTAYPPEAVRAGLLRTIERIAGQSRNVYTFRGNRIAKKDLRHIWQRVNVRDGFNYEIDRDHPLVAHASALAQRGTSFGLDPIFRAIEMALPVDSIYADMASDRVVQPRPADTDAAGTLEALAGRLLDAVSDDHDAKDRLLAGGLLELDVFAAHPEITKGIIKRLRHVN